MRIGTVDMARKIDEHCEHSLGIPLFLLMEHAALAVLKHLETEQYERYTIVCGYGNNGGDGLALARHLYVNGKMVSVFMVGREGSQITDCTKVNFQILRNMGISIKEIKGKEDIIFLIENIQKGDMTIDSILGTGLKMGVEGLMSDVIHAINEHSKKTIAIDVPSGMNGDSGAIAGAVIKADKTVCFELYKRGFLTYDSQSYVGKVIVEKIAIPSFVLDTFDQKEYITNRSFVQSLLKERGKFAYKSNFGNVMVVAGSEGFEGAAYLSTEAAVKCGSGLVTLATRESVREKVVGKFAEAMNVCVEDHDKFVERMTKMDGIAFGPGLGNDEGTRQLLKSVMRHATCPIVIDADGINVVANELKKDATYIQNINLPLVFTPHLGEMARLTGLSISYIHDNRLDVAKEFAKKHGVVILLKGYETVITDGEVLYVNPTGNSAMANGGMGDTLTGMITSFIGKGLSPLESAVAGAYLHGDIGDQLGRRLYTVNGTDIIRNLQQGMKALVEGEIR